MKAEIKHLNLSHIFRQKEKIDGNILSRIRTGSQTDEDLSRINRMVVVNPPVGAVVLCTSRAEAIRRNKEALDKVGGFQFDFQEVRSGTGLKKTSFGYKLQSKYAPFLSIKVGCRVIIKNNGTCQIDGLFIDYVNGDTGSVCEVDKQGRVCVDLDDGRYIRLNPHKIHDVSYTLSKKKKDEEGEIQRKSLGFVSQYPLSLGYAQTIHSAQGQTIPKVHIVLNNKRPFCPNMMYVAMSRVTSLANLTFNRPITHQDIWSTLSGSEKADQQYDLGVE